MSRVGLSAPHTAEGRLQRELLKLLAVHEREGTLPTSIRFLFYELVQAGVVPKAATGARRADQNHRRADPLREAGLVSWDWIIDETRSLDEFATAASVAEYVADAVRYASLDRWGGSRTADPVRVAVAGRGAARPRRALRRPIAATNGQCRGFLVSKVAPTLQPGQRVLYLGDWDHCGHQIEAATRSTLIEHSGDWDVEDERRPLGAGRADHRAGRRA